MTVNPNPYAFCPQCGAPGIARSRGLNGNDICANGHEYPSQHAATKAHDAQEDSRPAVYATQELPAPKPEGPEVWPVVLARFAAPEHAALRAELEARRDLGIQRYGQTVHRDDGRPLGVDAFQELEDALVYLQRDRMRVGSDDGELALDLDEAMAAIAAKAEQQVVVSQQIFGSPKPTVSRRIGSLVVETPIPMVRCPRDYCRAKPGNRCRGHSGTAIDTIHPERTRAFERQRSKS